MINPYAAPGADFSQSETSGGHYQPLLFSLSGRIGRVRYLAYNFLLFVLATLFMLVFAIVSVASIEALRSGFGQTLVSLVPLATLVLVMGIVVVTSVRRLYDLERGGWWACLTMVPFVNLVFGLWLACAKGNVGVNAHGPAPAANNWAHNCCAALLPVIIVISLACMVLFARQTGQ